jgi:hypothetical protein
MKNLKFEYFTNQYKVILRLLHFGIGNLPPELVLMILKDYVYIKPIRIDSYCMNCQHFVEGDTGYMSGWEIRKLFVKKGIDVPEHFQ